MANEAVIVELLGDRGDVINYTCASGANISKCALLFLSDPRTASGSVVSTSGSAFAGIAVSDKLASESKTTIGAYTYGIFDLTEAGGAGITVGHPVILSGANKIVVGSTSTIEGAIVGTALETFSASEVGLVLVKKR
jgi:hypothetical protein